MTKTSDKRSPEFTTASDKRSPEFTTASLKSSPPVKKLRKYDDIASSDTEINDEEPTKPSFTFCQTGK